MNPIIEKITISSIRRKPNALVETRRAAAPNPTDG
jgi:hypothetical protein